MKRASVAKEAAPIFARVFIDVAQQGEKTEDVAASILRIVKDGGIRTAEAFKAAVQEAYVHNGWQAKQGRPKGVRVVNRRRIPHTVRTYVWEINAAFQAGVKVWNADTFYALRLARLHNQGRKAVRATAASKTEKSFEQPELKGVRITDGEKPNGSLFHDLVLCYLKADEGIKGLLSRNLSRLLHRYSNVSMDKLKQAA